MIRFIRKSSGKINNPRYGINHQPNRTPMRNFFFAPSKATLESPEIGDYLRTLGNFRVAEANAKANSDLLRRLKTSQNRSDITSIACILTAPTDNSLLDGGTSIAVGRGITDIGMEALHRQIPTFICRKLNQSWVFYPVINFDSSKATGNWKLDYSRAILELPDTADNLFK